MTYNRSNYIVIEDNAYEHENERKNYEKRQTKIVIKLHIKKKTFLFIPTLPVR